jgi:hypothetical protein
MSADQRTGDGRSVWEFVAIEPTAAARFLVSVAMLRRDGEGEDREGDPWQMENDHAYDTLHGLIDEARDLLNWRAGTVPLDHPDYATATASDENPLITGTHDCDALPAGEQRE